jgi:hypothetical protein
MRALKSPDEPALLLGAATMTSGVCRPVPVGVLESGHSPVLAVKQQPVERRV